jgi:hypothetical protein
MNIEYVLVAALLLMGGGLLTVGIGLSKALNRVSIPSKKPTYINYPLKKSIEYDLLLSRLLHKIKDELNATKIVVARFHNGGNFYNGLAMKKFSIYMETASANSTIPCMQDTYRDVLNTRYPEVFNHLVVWEDYICADIGDCIDINFKQDAKRCGFKSVNLFLIKQLNGVEEGFVGINFNYTHVMTPEQRSIVTEEIPKILGMLNMTKL